MDFEDILKNYLGEFGLYQAIWMLLICSFAINTSFNTMEYVFIGITPEFWCSEADVDHLSPNLTRQELIALTSPKGSNGEYDTCRMYDVDYSSLSESDAWNILNGSISLNISIVKCSAWTFSKDQVQSTIVTEWNLVCDKEWLVAVSQSVYMAGKLTELIVGGIGDKYGRRVLALSMICQHIIARFAATFAYNYGMFLVAKFFMSAASSNWYSAAIVMSIEMVGSKYRTFSGQLPYFFWSVGYMLVALIAYFIRDWRQLSLVLSLFAVPYLLQFCFLPESVRWLLTNDKTKEAGKIIRQMARVNRKELPENYDKLLIKISENEKSQRRGLMFQIKSIIKSWKYIKITLIFFAIWFTVNISYYGFMYYIPKLGGSVYLNTALSGLMEIPALLIVYFTLDSRLGRKFCCSASLFLTSAVLILLVLVPQNASWLVITLAMLARVTNTYIFSTLYIYTVEVYPTTTRTLCLNLCSFASRIAGTLSPFVVLMTNYSMLMPPILFASMLFCCVVLSRFLPETRGHYLKDKVNQAVEEKNEKKQETETL